MENSEYNTSDEESLEDFGRAITTEPNQNKPKSRMSERQPVTPVRKIRIKAQSIGKFGNIINSHLYLMNAFPL